MWGQANPDLALQTYDIQGSLQKDSQVTVSVVVENQSSSFLKNMELNVLDSLNTKLARPEGSSVHDGVPVPFQLPPGVQATGRTSRAGGRSEAPAAPSLLGPGTPPVLSPGVPWTEPSFLTSVGSRHCHLPGCQTTARHRPCHTQAPLFLPSPGISNEAQFVFTIQSIVMAQKLKGTLSFIAKVPGLEVMVGAHRRALPPAHSLLLLPQNDEGSTHEKLDFKLHFSCTSYLVTTPCYRCVATHTPYVHTLP